VLERVAACCRVMPQVVACCSVSNSEQQHELAACCSMLQHVAASCSVLQNVAAGATAPESKSTRELERERFEACGMTKLTQLIQYVMGLISCVT